MLGKEINDHIRRSLAVLVESADELRDLDQALGDGDLGITITAGSHAVIAELEKLPDSATPTEIARTCARRPGCGERRPCRSVEEVSYRRVT